MKNSQIAAITFHEAIGAESLVSSEILMSLLEDDEAAPFTEIRSDSDLDGLTFTLDIKTLHRFSYYSPPHWRDVFSLNKFLQATLTGKNSLVVLKRNMPTRVIWTVKNINLDDKLMGECYDSLSEGSKRVLADHQVLIDALADYFDNVLPRLQAMSAKMRSTIDSDLVFEAYFAGTHLELVDGLL